MRCMDCGSVMRRTTEPITEEYKGYTLTVSDIEHYKCDACGEYEISADEADRLSHALLIAYARARDLLTPQEVRAIRKRLGMTQSQFEKALGVSAPAVSRWETGAAAPSKSVCKLMRMFDAHPDLVEGPGERHDATQESTAVVIHSQWKVFDGGRPQKIGGPSHYVVSASKKHSYPETCEAKEG